MRAVIKNLVTVALLSIIFNQINAQTYFSKAYDIDSCYNEGTVIGLIESDSIIQVAGAMFCGIPYFHGSGSFSISKFDGHMLTESREDRFNIIGRTSSLIDSGFVITGTGSFVPEKGIWKTDRHGVVLDSFLFNHPDSFVYARVLAPYQGGYVTSIVHQGASKFDLIQLDSNLDLTAYYAEYVNSDPGDEPNHHWEGPDGELYFTICLNSFGGECDNLEVLRFSPNGNHELIYKLPIDEEHGSGEFNGMALPADDSSFYYTWNRDTFYYDEELDRYFADPGIVSKVTYSGERLWDAYFWEFDGKAIESFTTANGDLVILGELFVHYPHQPGTYPEATMVAGGYAARITPEGEILWKRKILDPINCKNDGGQPCFSTFYNGAELPNGDLLFTGRIDTIIPGLPSNQNRNTNTWVVKTDANGCLRPDCGLLEILDTTFYTSTRNWVPQRRAVARLNISPNPVGGLGQVRIYLPEGVGPANDGRLRLVDQLGRVIDVRSGVRLPYALSTAALEPGYYTLQWLDEREGKVWTGRLVVLR